MIYRKDYYESIDENLYSKFSKDKRYKKYHSKNNYEMYIYDPYFFLNLWFIGNGIFLLCIGYEFVVIHVGFG
jgi:hypothetical protein